MKISFKATAFLFLIMILFGFQYHPADQSAGPEADSSKRPFYEYPGDYGKEVQELMDKFKAAFGYEMVEFGEAWRTDQIERLHEAFSRLPPTFYNMPGIKAIYRLNRIMAGPGQIPRGEIPAATLPGFASIYKSQSYQVLVENQDPRVEFYSPLFHEDKEVLNNIVHHEMAHLFDMTHGFLSVSAEWLALANFRVLNIPALDGKPDSDFIYTFLNDSEVDNYAPTSLRHLPTYSRQNIQEDFANSAAAYINYPYFRYSHPKRYEFLRRRVFGGKEYFPADVKNPGFQEKILADFKSAMEKKDWPRATRILAEVSRGYYPGLESELVRGLGEEMDSGSAADRVLQLSSCFLQDPGALELRKRLIIKKHVTEGELLRNERCFRVGRDNFQKNLVKWTPANVFFFRENGRDFIQFLDPVLFLAHSRGYNTRYSWRAFEEGEETKLIAEGKLDLENGGNGSVKIDLAAVSERKFALPEGRKLVLELGASRMHPRTFQSFESNIAKIRFVVRPGFKYLGPRRPDIRVIYPFRAAYEWRG